MYMKLKTTHICNLDVWYVLVRLTKAQHVLPNLVEVISLPFLRGMQYDDCRAKNREQTANLAVKIKPLLEQGRRQHSTVYICKCMSMHAASISHHSISRLSL